MLFIGTSSISIRSSFESSDEQIDQQQIINEGYFSSSIPTDWAQSFKPTMDSLTKVELNIQKKGNPTGSLTVSIRDSLSGSNIISTSVSTSSISSSGGWVVFDFNDIFVTPEVTYYIIFHPDSSWSGGHMVDWGMFYSYDTYTRGIAYWYWDIPSPWWYPIDGDDFCFKTYGLAIENLPPNSPSNPTPANHATGVVINADLSWTGGDPDFGDTVTYDIYFGTNSNPPLKKSDNTVTSYDPGTMDTNTKYYWKIVAKDNHGASTTGQVWDFTTLSMENQPPIIDIISPEENSILTGLVNIYGIASDPDGNETLTQVEVKIDDKPWQNATDLEYWNYSWNTDNETEGIHTIKARSYDGELYSNYSVVNVTLQHDKPDIVIIDVNGGFGVSASIINNGAAPANNLSWSIDVEANIGLILSGSHTEDVIDTLASGDSLKIQSNNLRGIGLITITVRAADAEKQATAFLLGPLVLRVNEI